jgi:hypothetical protein
MKYLYAALLGLLLTAGPAQASVDFHTGSLYRTEGVPAWSADRGIFTIMLWVYAPEIDGMNDFCIADDGGAFKAYANIGTAGDNPRSPFFLTHGGEWHFNKDGSYTANPEQGLDVSLGWTFLAVSFTHNGATDLYAWQAGVNHDALIHVPAQTHFSSIGGSGSVNTFVMGNQSSFNEGCRCYMGPVYVYDGLALTRQQIDAQRLQSDPIIKEHLIVYSSFEDGKALARDNSATANWTTHGNVSFNTMHPPIKPSEHSDDNGGETTGGETNGGSHKGGGAFGLLSVLGLLMGAALRRQRG